MLDMASISQKMDSMLEFTVIKIKIVFFYLIQVKKKEDIFQSQTIGTRKSCRNSSVYTFEALFLCCELLAQGRFKRKHNLSTEFITLIINIQACRKSFSFVDLF